MKRSEKNHQQNGKFDPIEHILASEEPLVPSSGFLAAVMERVEDESRAPAPIPFPWKRAVPGFVLGGGVFGWGAYEFIRAAIPAMGNMAISPAQLEPTLSEPMKQAAWVGLALLISLLSWILSRRISGQRGWL